MQRVHRQRRSRPAQGLIVFLLATALLACQLLSGPTGAATPESDLIATAAALTVEAQFTRSAASPQPDRSPLPAAQTATPAEDQAPSTPALPATCGQVQPPRLAVDGQAEVVVFQVKIRGEPGLGSEQLEVLARDRLLTVLEGPRCVDELWWWRVLNEELALEGWVAESDAANYYLAPAEE